MENRQRTEVIQLSNQKRIRTLGEKENYKYLGILETDTMKQAEMNEKIRKEFLRTTRKLPETKFCSRNLIKRINIRAVPLVRYSGPFSKWTKEKLRQMDQRIRKLMTIQKALYPRENIHRLYGSRKEGGRRLASVEDCFDASSQVHESDVKKRKKC